MIVKLSRSESLKMLEEARMKQIMDQQAHKDYWINVGREKGYKEGYEKAYKSAYKAAYEQTCRLEGQQGLIKNMLSGGVAIDDIVKWSGLSAQEILEIQKNSSMDRAKKSDSLK